jgi:16S rRNA processing protein RimM
MSDDLVLVGRIGAAHGIRGEVRVKAFTDPAVAIADYGPLTLRDGRRLTVARLRDQGTMLIVAFREVTDRNAAETLNGLDLHVPRSALPEPEDEETFYHTDLIGLAVVDGSGTELGRIVAVPDFGAGDLLEVRREGRPSFYVPFTRAFVPVVAVKEGRVEVDLPDDFFETKRPEGATDDEEERS